MTSLLRFARRMNVLLFMAFFCISLVFTLLLSAVYNVHWESLFESYQKNLLNESAHRYMDDMRFFEIGAGPLDGTEIEMMKRRANLNGILIRYTSEDGRDVWLDTIRDFDMAASKEAVDANVYPYILGGKTVGKLHVANLAARNRLNPTLIEYQEQLKVRSYTMYVSIVIISLLFSLWISRVLSRHLERLGRRTKEIRLGNLDVNIPIEGPEEIRQLAATLAEMVKELKKHEDWRLHLMEDLTHELRTPLTSMLTQLEAIQDGVYKVSKEWLHDIYEELERLARLISDLERLSEAESARFTLRIRRTDMVRLARSVCENFQPLARAAQVTLSFRNPNVPCHCEVDRDKMVQIISNLLTNAIKYNVPGGTVVLHVRWQPEHTEIVCEDSGIGISEEDLPYVFNRLFRADRSRSRFNSGVGLGLSIVKALVEAHNGVVTVTSELGAGSTFTVRLPNRFTGTSDGGQAQG